MKNLILFGPPGAGKGTQASLLAGHYELIHISTGDIFREEIKTQTELGLRIKSIIDKGELVPDAILIEIIQGVFEKHRNSKGILLDGFPRTVAQAEALDQLMLSEHSEITKVLSLKVDDEELIARLLKRAELLGRTDDSEDVIRNRLKVYNLQTLPLEDYYIEKQKYVSLMGVGSVEEIFASLCNIIDKL